LATCSKFERRCVPALPGFVVEDLVQVE